MKNLEDELVSEESLQSGITVTLIKNQLDKAGGFFARVKSRLATVKAALGLIAKKNKGIDTSAIKTGLELYNDEVIDLLSMGYAVKILDIGVLQIKHRGAVKDKNEAMTLSNFTVEFTPSAAVSEAVKNLKVDAVLEVMNEPEIKSLMDLWRQESDGKITIGRPFQVLGQNLKLDTGIDEVFFVPLTASGADDLDEENWIKAASNAVFRNKPSELNIYASDNLESGKKYRLLLRMWKGKDDNPKAFEISTKSDIFEAVNA